MARDAEGCGRSPAAVLPRMGAEIGPDLVAEFAVKSGAHHQSLCRWIARRNATTRRVPKPLSTLL